MDNCIWVNEQDDDENTRKYFDSDALRTYDCNTLDTDE